MNGNWNPYFFLQLFKTLYFFLHRPLHVALARIQVHETPMLGRKLLSPVMWRQQTAMLEFPVPHQLAGAAMLIGYKVVLRTIRPVST